MPYNNPSTEELVNRNRTQIEANLNQNTPLSEKAFNTVLSTVEALADRELYGYASDLTRENLALTASEDGLGALGEEYGIYRFQPTAWEGMAAFDIPDGETLYFGTAFIGPQGFKYETSRSATAPYLEPGSGVLVPITCTEFGPSGNLSVGDTLSIQIPIGTGRTAKVVEIITLGTSIEDLESYRQRLLDFERSEGGGGNSSDYRTWAQGVPGVRRAYPFSGPPEDVGHDALPGERTVYIECLPEVDSEGIPPQSLLDLVWTALQLDPGTGESREVLGLTRDTLYVRPIVRTKLYVTVKGMAVSVGNIGDAEAAVSSALAVFFEGFSPFVQGLDPDFDKKDTVTASVIGREVQNVLDAYGGTAQEIFFGTSPAVSTGRYELKQNEKVKLEQTLFEGAE